MLRPHLRQIFRENISALVATGDGLEVNGFFLCCLPQSSRSISVVFGFRSITVIDGQGRAWVAVGGDCCVRCHRIFTENPPAIVHLTA